MSYEILEPFINLLCPTSEAASSCRDFISSHSNVVPPIGPVLYFLLFPIVFIIIFVYILKSSILPGGNLGNGLQALIGISVFIFIIINGWYPLMLVLSEVWFIVIIFLFGVWYFISKHHKGKGSGGGGGSFPGLGGIGGEITARIYRDVTGQTKRLEKRVDLALKEMEGLEKAIKSDPSAWRAYSSRIDYCWSLIKEYKDAISIGGVPVGGRLKEKVDRLEKVLDRMESYAKKGK
ncbi:MAG: hypothetical protein QXN71_00760 [Candidatus Aenigmatarchaeota archaeon]